MPSRVNGIGTWYWGKTNIITRTAKCEFCGNAGTLTSYDTTLFFTVLFLPVIPLQRKRVLNQCSRCKRHRAISLKKWEQQKTTALVEALGAWQADRTNADKARNAVNVTIGFQDRQAFEDLSSSVTQAFSRDADMQMFIAGGHDHFNQLPAAENAYRSAVAIRNDAATRRAYAGYLMRQLRPDDAAPLLQDILTTKDRTGAPLLLLQAQAYQALGNHTAAAKLLDETSTAFPDLLSTADFQRISAISSKYRGTNKRIKTLTLDPNQRGGARNANWLQRNGAKLVVSTLITLVAAWYLITAANGYHQKVFVVNGTSIPYVAVIDGREHHVPAKSELPLNLDEGSHAVSVQNHPEIEPASVNIRTNFWTRPFTSRTFAINPDRVALLFERDVEYSSNPSTHPPSHKHPSQFYAGQAFYNLKRPDDPFTDPPHSVELSSDSAIVTRRHLSQLTKLSMETELEMIQRQIGAQASTEWLKRFAATSDEGPDSMKALGMLDGELPPAEMIAYLKPRIGDRPVRVLWHRIYQSLMEKHHPEYDLSADYRAMLAAHPDDSTLIYLTGRSSQDRAEMKSMFARAAYSPKPCAYALYALAYENLGQTHFAEALPLIQNALRMEPKNPQFIWTQSQTWEALGQSTSALQLSKSLETHDGEDSGVIADEVRFLAASGNQSAAKQCIYGYCSELNSLKYDKENVDYVRNSLMSTYSYTVGDVAAFKNYVKNLKSPDIAWEIALMDRDYAAAEQLLKDRKDPSHEPFVVLSALAYGAGNTEIADRAWAAALDMMKKGDRDERLFAATISGAAPASVEQIVRDCPGFPINRCALMTCLGQRHPDQREGLFALARKLNFSTQFPHREIAAALDAKQ